MGKYVLSLSVILCTLMIGVAIAQEKQEKAAEQKPQPATVQRAGDVVTIDATKNEIVIKDEAGAEAHLLITASTKITKAGKAITLADVKAGDKLSGECVESPDGCKATKIDVMSITPEKPAPEKPTPEKPKN